MQETCLCKFVFRMCCKPVGENSGARLCSVTHRRSGACIVVVVASEGPTRGGGHEGSGNQRQNEGRMQLVLGSWGPRLLGPKWKKLFSTPDLELQKIHLQVVVKLN